MLTKEAFNALLKTLEEPPSHVIFILATTEEEKLLETIISRCQVFRMRSPSRAVLATVVIDVAKKEGFKLSKDAADLIAVAADGSFRDALGITQKVILASGDEAGSADEVAAIIGAPRAATLVALLHALHEKNTSAALEIIFAAAAARVDMKLFGRLLLEHIRAVILLRNLPEQAEHILSPFGTETQSALNELSKQPVVINSHVLQRFLNAVIDMQRAPVPHIALEIAVLDVTQSP
jgi:DNA polymerase-3 subunit gamma/tau